MEIIKQFKALSDPTRLRLLNILNHFELNVNEIVSIVDMIQSGVSRHLKILLEAGLLVSRKDGSFIYYCANKTDYTLDLITLACHGVEKEELFAHDLHKARQSITIRKNKAKRFFRTIAPQWGRLKKEVLGDFDLDHVLKKKTSRGRAVADLGCGTGDMLGQLLFEHKQVLIGVDSSPDMLEQARIRLPDHKGLDLRLGEVENLPMRDQEVDTVIMSMVLYHIIEPEKVIREVHRVLSGEGLFFLSDFEKHDQENIKEIIGGSWLGFEKKQIMEWLDDAGFLLKSFDRFEVEKELCINLYIAQKI